MKKLWLLGMLLLFARPVWADFVWTYYGGISAGMNVNSAQIDQASTLNIIGVYDNTTGSDADKDHFSPVGQLQLGAGLKNELFYLGAEISGQFFEGGFGAVTSSFAEDTFIDVPTHVKKDDSSTLKLNDFEFALDFKPGVYLYQHTLLYARVGIGINELSLDQTIIATSEGEQLEVHSNTSDNVFPLRLGMGLERRFYEAWSVTFDYVYTQYPDISTQGQTTGTLSVPDPNPIVLAGHTEATDISRQTVMLGFNYYLQ